MNDIQKKLETIKETIKQSYSAQMDVEGVKATMVDWLRELKFPKYPNAATWEECLHVYREKPDTDEVASSPSMKLRMSLKLHTNQHNYFISIIEPGQQQLDTIGIITVHVNLDEKEDNILHSLDSTYQQDSSSAIHARQTLWIQPFTMDNIRDAFHSCALAILGNELVGAPVKELKTTIKNPGTLKADFPE